MSKEIGLVLPPSEGDRVPEPSQFWRRTREKGRKQQERKGNAAKFLAPSRRTSTEGAAGLQPNEYRVQGRAVHLCTFSCMVDLNESFHVQNSLTADKTGTVQVARKTHKKWYSALLLANSLFKGCPKQAK